MVRIQDFEKVKTGDPSIPFLTGVFKPIVGTCFALFVYAFLNSGLIPISSQPQSSAYFFMALSFVAGFSERFARDIASQAEKSVPHVS